MLRRIFSAITVAVLGVSIGATGAIAAPSNPETTPPSEPSSALEVLAGLTVAPEYSGPAQYDRNAWGDWTDPDGNKCNTRQDVLKRDIPDALFAEDDPCELIYGQIQDPYQPSVLISHDEREIPGGYTSPIDIDHVVSVQEAFDSGAHAWSAAQRTAFYNDLDNLIAVSAGQNRSKSDKDIAEWLPPEQSQYCAFASTVVYVKDKYGLSVDQLEQRELHRILSGADCAGTTAAPAAQLAVAQLQPDAPAALSPTDPAPAPVGAYIDNSGS